MKMKFGDKVVEAEMKDGVPVIKARAETIKHADGRVDVKIHVPYLSILAKKE